MAAGQGYIEFATGDVLTASAANGYLASQVVMVFASASARTSAIASPQEGMVSYLKDTNSIEYYTGSAWAAVGGGGGGKVLQVVQATTTTETSLTSATWTDSGLSASITPSASTSRVLVLTTQVINLGQSDDTGIMAGGTRLLRGSTNVFTPYEGSGISFYESDYYRGITSMHYVDSPATTSSTTYKTQIYLAITGGGASITAQPASAQSSIILMEIGA